MYKLIDSYPTSVSIGVGSSGVTFTRPLDHHVFGNVSNTVFRNPPQGPVTYERAYYTPSAFGGVTVNAPVDNSLQISTEVPQIQRKGFLENEQ